MHRRFEEDLTRAVPEDKEGEIMRVHIDWGKEPESQALAQKGVESLALREIPESHFLHSYELFLKSRCGGELNKLDKLFQGLPSRIQTVPELVLPDEDSLPEEVRGLYQYFGPDVYKLSEAVYKDVHEGYISGEDLPEEDVLRALRELYNEIEKRAEILLDLDELFFELIQNEKFNIRDLVQIMAEWSDQLGVRVGSNFEESNKNLTGALYKTHMDLIDKGEPGISTNDIRRLEEILEDELDELDELGKEE